MRVVIGLLLFLGSVICGAAALVPEYHLMTSYHYDSGIGFWTRIGLFTVGVLVAWFLWSRYKTLKLRPQTNTKILMGLLVLALIVGPMFSWIYGSIFAKAGMFGLLLYLKILLECIGFVLLAWSISIVLGWSGQSSK